MSRKLKKVTQRWLEIERRATADAADGTAAVAETALSRVFRALPMPIPSAALANRTLAQLGLATGVTPPPHWAYRWAVSTALALSGLATALYAPALLSSLNSRVTADWIVDVGAGLLVAVFHRLAAGYTLWDVMARAGATAAEVMATPQTLGLMLATVLFGLATFRVLAGLVAFEGSSYHA